MSDAPVVELRDPRFDENKYGFIEELRSQNYYARTGNGDVLFLNQDDVIEVFRCEDFQFAFDTIDEERSPYLAEAIKHELLAMHGDQHARLARLVKQALRDRLLEDMRTDITRIVDELIAAFPSEGTLDFCAAFADPLPAHVVGPMFGVPYTSVKDFNDWIRIGGRKIDALQTGVGIEEVESANRKMHDYLRDLLAERRQAPGDDLFSELMLADIDGDVLSEDELVYLATELASAGVDTTRAQLPLILHALLTHPDEMQKLRADPKLALRAVDEGMRYAPLPWALPHRATHDFTYKTIDFREGDLVYAFVPAANRDPAAIDAPQTFDISRARARNFSFGAGMHGCPGAQLARMEMSIALQHLATADFEMTLVGEPDWVPGQKDRGMKSMTIRLD